MAEASGWRHQPVTAYPATRFRCPECNWQHLIATAGAPPVGQCPWCGWPEVVPELGGAFAVVACPVHGPAVCVITDASIRVEDYMDLSCPHCHRPGS